MVDVQWSPFAARDYWVASTANHRCLVWNLNMRDDSPSGAIEHSLQAHSRAITDINFSAHHPDSLATCAVDGYVYLWDLRRPRQPALAFCDWFAGATQVKYNRQDPHILASAHDRRLHIWDTRRAVEPLKTISAHTSKIYGIDWNRTKATCLVTCSLDKSIKFWDYGRDHERPQRVIRTDFPVWRARHTPFGYGLLAMPQTEPGNLYLYDQRADPDAPVDGPVEPVTVFPGHGDHKAKEFLWRSRGGVTSEGIDNREFQLVSWGEDNELRLHKVDHRLLESVGHVRGGPVMENLNITRRGAIYKTFRTVDDTVRRDRRSATMSDPRPSSGGQFLQSALSLGVNARLRRAGPAWRTTTMKAKTKSGKNVDKTQLQIGWMKGITMSKRKSISSVPTRGSGLFGPDYDDRWGEPEAIQEELLRISSQLPNVKWENIDMDSLTLNASLKGPWGVNREPIFIKVKVDIPTTYPKSKAPKFYVEKSSFMPDETHRKLELELHELGNRFLERKKNCLYTAFTYLLGETDLESSTAFFKNVRDFDDDDIDALADESSSDEDENDIPTGGSASMSQELTGSTELDPTATLATAQRQAVTPLPMHCGARFSNDGRLVCFFPTKEEKAKALFALPHPDASRERQKGEPTFAGFGRLPQDSPQPKHRFHDDTSATDDESSESDDTDSTSSTDSEPTTLHKIGLWYHPGRHFRKTWSADESVRSSGGGTGAGTGTGTGTSKKRPGKPKNIVSIHNLQSDLPSKKQFAQEYAIFGDGADVCSHNASVAEKYGQHDLAHVWRYAALLLRRDIPLELHELHHMGQSVLVIARDAVARSRGEGGKGNGSTTPGSSLAGRVRWGHHPLARDMIDDLFDYYEKIADVQMLAMLACVFGDYSIQEEAALAASHLPQPKTPLQMKAPSFSLEYFPTDPVLWNTHYRSQASSGITTPRTVNTPAMYSHSPNSEDTSGLVESRSHSYSCGETPPNPAREHLREVGQTQSLSTSPNNRLFHRANSTMAAAFAASLPRALAGIVSGSPPDPVRKRLSPSDTLLSSLTPNVMAWAGSAASGAAPETPGTSRTSLSDDEYWRDDLISMVPVAVSCISENQGLFDDDGWMSTPLIDRDRSQLYSSYRYAYAEMLQMWGQPLSRLEIMKFNVLRDDKPSSLESLAPQTNYAEEAAGPHGTPFYPPGTTPPTSPFADRKSYFQDLAASGRAVEVTGFCQVHPNTPLEPAEYLRSSADDSDHGYGHVNGAVGVCHRCALERDSHKHPHAAASDLAPQTETLCVYCWRPVAGLYAPCLACGCVTHDACLADWHAGLGTDDGGSGECPAGHECQCVEEASTERVGTWPVLLVADGDDGEGDSLLRGGFTRDVSSSRSGGGTPRSTASASASTRARRKSAPAETTQFLRDAAEGAGGNESGARGSATPASTIRAFPARRAGTTAAAAAAADALARRRGGSRDYYHHRRHYYGDSDAASASTVTTATTTAASTVEDHDRDRDRDRDSDSVASAPAPAVPAVTVTGAAGAATGPGALLAGVKPPVRGEEPVSAAQLSLGKRLKLSLEESSGRPGVLRRNSGGLAMWKSSGG